MLSYRNHLNLLGLVLYQVSSVLLIQHCGTEHGISLHTSLKVFLFEAHEPPGEMQELVVKH